MLLVIFDIDGTLLNSGGAGTKSMEITFNEVLSIKNPLSSVSMAGKTDPEIIRESLRRLGIAETDGLVPRLSAGYLKHLRETIKNPFKRLMPRVSEVLLTLSSSTGVSLGILTGNFEQGAKIKLDAFGLGGYFGFGAYGSDHGERLKLLPVALARYNALSGKKATFSDCVIVGDTPYDVQCAKPHGAFTVGVATGPYSAEELRAAGAHLVLKQLPGGDDFLGLLKGLTSA